MNPLGIMPVFMTMTDSLDKQERKVIARKANMVAALTLILFAFSGQLLFKFFGISVNSFRMVGGIIFFMMGWDMLQAKLVKVKMNKKSVNREYEDDISVTPLAIPMICGPGAITNAIVLMEDAKTFEMKGIVIGSILLVCFLSFLVLWSSGKITVLIGKTGNKIMMRLMGLIMMVIAVEFFFSGLQPILKEIIHAQA
jgi:multiple antibiotic resistance protein|tara:strand:+ start:408 stop:998 length:591 start_codon:yes stop_codon:yes gene_type:complete